MSSGGISMAEQSESDVPWWLQPAALEGIRRQVYQMASFASRLGYDTINLSFLNPELAGYELTAIVMSFSFARNYSELAQGFDEELPFYVPNLPALNFEEDSNEGWFSYWHVLWMRGPDVALAWLNTYRAEVSLVHAVSTQPSIADSYDMVLQTRASFYMAAMEFHPDIDHGSGEVSYNGISKIYSRYSMDDVILWEKRLVGNMNMPNLMEALHFPLLQIPQLKQHDSNQNNSEKSVSTMTSIARLVKAVKRSSPKALSAAVDAIHSIVSTTDVFAGSHPGEGGARSFFHEHLASTKRGHVERRNFKVINNVDEKTLKQFYSVESSSRLEVNHVLLEEVGEINHVLIDTKLSISDKSITLVSGAGEDVEGMIVNCTFSPISRSSSTEKFHALPMWFLIPANGPLCTPVLLDCSHDSQSHSYEYEQMQRISSIGPSAGFLIQLLRGWPRVGILVLMRHFLSMPEEWRSTSISCGL